MNSIKNNTEKIDAQLPVVAAFDFDGTLTYHDTLFPFLLFVSGRVKAFCKLLWLSPVLIGYVMGMVSRQQAKERVLTSFFEGMSIDKLCEHGKRFAVEWIPKFLKPEALKRLRWHQEQGHRCVLVSASIDAYIESWAEIAGFNDVICSRVEITDQKRVTGRLIGNNCWGVEKIRRLEESLGPRDQYCLYAYGDSRGDLELLAYADHTFYRKMPM